MGEVTREWSVESGGETDAMLGVGIEMGEMGLVAATGAGAAAEASAPLEGWLSIGFSLMGFSMGFAAATGEGGACWDLREKVREKAFPRVDFFFSSIVVLLLRG